MISISQLRISFLLLLFVISLTKGLEFVIVIESHVSCYGRDDGVASVNITNGVPPFKIYWPTIDSESTTAGNLVAGIHNVSVKDSGNNEVTQFFNMLQPSKLEGGAYSYSSTSSCDKLGSISALAYGGTPPYVYSWQGQDLSVLVAQPSLTIFDEVLSPKFLLNDVNNFVDLHSASIEAFSGLWSIKIESKTNFKFSILCDSSVSPACIQSILYSGIQFWMWKEDSVGKFFVGLLDKNGDISENGYTEFSFTAGTWSSGFLDFSNILQDSYSGIYIATTGAFHFHLDDIALLPKREDFVVSSGPVGSLQIGTPSAVYGAAGQYNVRIEDSNKCPVTLSLNINSVPTMQNKIKVDGQSLIVSTVGGTPPFRYNLTADLNNNTLSNQLGTFTNLIPGNYTIEVLDSRTCRDTQHVVILPPFVPIPPPDVTFTNYKVINFFLGTLAGVFAIITVFLIVLVHKRRNDLRPHSLLFCQTILIGSLLGYVSAILALLNVSWSKGIAFAWTVDFAVTIIYGSMFAKSMQILKILDNFTKFVSIDTTDRYMAKVFSFIIVPELLLLIIWTSLTGSVLQKKYTAGQGEVIFWNIFLIYKGIVGLLASFVCFRMRYKFKEYREIQQIAYCHYSLEVLLAFLLIFTLIARERYTELFIGVQSFSVSVIVTIPLLVIISPIVARAIKEYRDEKRTQKWRSLPMYS